MSEDFMNVPTGDDRPVGSTRRSVKILMIGQPEDVEQTRTGLAPCLTPRFKQPPSENPVRLCGFTNAMSIGRRG
jgi:hypothetical protein